MAPPGLLRHPGGIGQRLATLKVLVSAASRTTLPLLIPLFAAKAGKVKAPQGRKRERPRRKVYAFRAACRGGRARSLPWHVPRRIVHSRPLPRSAHKMSRGREDAAMLAYRSLCRGGEPTSWVSVSSSCPGSRTICTSPLSLTGSRRVIPCRRCWWHYTTPGVPRQGSVLDFGAAASYHFRSPDPRIRIHQTNRSRRCESSIPTFTC